MILVVALIFIGPDQLPKVARKLGDGMRQVRGAMTRVDDEVRRTIREATADDAIAEDNARRAEAEARATEAERIRLSNADPSALPKLEEPTAEATPASAPASMDAVDSTAKPAEPNLIAPRKAPAGAVARKTAPPPATPPATPPSTPATSAAAEDVDSNA